MSNGLLSDHYGDVSERISQSKEKDNCEELKLYNKTVKDWLLGRQQFCFVQPAASGNRSVSQFKLK